ncbi:MAG TPA: ACT domain-containing protein, partial [Aminivibrio sp.]|nr:ACT domain-containing protein [Aminivibrio sp.]
SKVILAHNANWEASKMARLGGVFAGIVQVSVEREHADSLARDLQDLTDGHMTVSVRDSEPIDMYEGYASLTLTLAGADHEGIVQSFSRFLAELGVNVEELETELENAPLSGVPLFNATFELKSPPSLNLKELKKMLDNLAKELAVDFKLKETV